MIRRTRIGLLFGMLLFLLACGYETAASQGSITLQIQFPVQNEKTRIFVQTQAGNPIVGAHVMATYRPGSRVEEESEIGITDSGGAVDWIPEEAGIVAVSAEFTGEDGDAAQLSTNVSVKFASTPLSGVLKMLLAGTHIIGGSIIRFARYIRGQGF
jgi:hypothetical protein